jgi:hypothetical protein
MSRRRAVSIKKLVWTSATPANATCSTGASASAAARVMPSVVHATMPMAVDTMVASIIQSRSTPTTRMRWNHAMA